MSNSAVVAQKNPFGLRIGWQVKITTDDIDDISSVEENISHSCELGSSMHRLWVPVIRATQL
jgi:hypothetical protein